MMMLADVAIKRGNMPIFKRDVNTRVERRMTIPMILSHIIHLAPLMACMVDASGD